MKRFLLALIMFLPTSLLAQIKVTGDTPKYLLPPPVIQEMPIRDSVMHIKRLPLQSEWEEQTAFGTNALTEKVTAGFFSTGKGAGIYAFHNSAARGTVLQVKNLNNDRVIYVKVLGQVPVTRAFRGCSLGLSSGAKSALAVRDLKAYCEISYLSY